jgi:hypothetical protein
VELKIPNSSITNAGQNFDILAGELGFSPLASDRTNVYYDMGDTLTSLLEV